LVSIVQHPDVVVGEGGQRKQVHEQSNYPKNRSWMRLPVQRLSDFAFQRADLLLPWLAGRHVHSSQNRMGEPCLGAEFSLCRLPPQSLRVSG
jgi:hypothetical protein